MTDLPRLMLLGSMAAPQPNQDSWAKAVAAYPGQAFLHLYQQGEIKVPFDLSPDSLIVVVAADVAPTPSWLTDIAFWFAEHPNAVLGGIPIDRSSNNYERIGWDLIYPNLLHLDQNTVYEDQNTTVNTVQHIVRGALICRASLYQYLSGFDPLLGDSLFADIDFCRRATACGVSIWWLKQLPVTCNTPDDVPFTDESRATYEDELLAFKLRYGKTSQAKHTVISEQSSTLSAAQLSLLRQQLNAITASMATARHYAVPDPFEFRSTLPVVGKLISYFRELWYAVAAKWAIKALTQQQSIYNHATLEALQQLQSAMQALLEQVANSHGANTNEPATATIDPLPPVIETQITQTVHRLTQSMLEGRWL